MTDDLNINKTIYMTYNKSVPDYVFNKWTDLNSDFKIDFSLDNECIDFIKDNFNDALVDVFKNIKRGAHKADLWRLCKLYINGGIYADVDLVPYLNINNLDKDVTFYTCLSAINQSCFQAFMVNFSKPRNPLILSFLITLILNKPFNDDIGPTKDMYNTLNYNIDTITKDTKYHINTVRIPVEIGNSKRNIKKINLLYFPKLSKISINILSNKNLKETFSAKIQDTFLIIKKSSNSTTGWKQNLKVEIEIPSKEVIYLFKEHWGARGYTDAYVTYKNIKILDSRDCCYSEKHGFMIGGRPVKKAKWGKTRTSRNRDRKLTKFYKRNT